MFQHQLCAICLTSWLPPVPTVASLLVFATIYNVSDKKRTQLTQAGNPVSTQRDCLLNSPPTLSQINHTRAQTHTLRSLVSFPLFQRITLLHFFFSHISSRRFPDDAIKFTTASQPVNFDYNAPNDKYISLMPTMHAKLHTYLQMSNDSPTLMRQHQRYQNIN